MGESTNKGCQICGETIQDNERSKKCETCGEMYHEKCWNEKGGCMNETCKVKVEIDKEEKVFCPHCSKELLAEQKYCPNCGKSVVDNQKKYCGGCGAEIDANQKFCINCGYKIVELNDVNLSPIIGQMGEKGKTRVRKSKRKMIGGVAALIALVFLVLIILPKIFVSTEQLMAKGNYEKAYQKAKEEEKDNVLIENLVAFECKSAADALKDPSSFNLREAWFDKDMSQMVLSISGKNGMGGVTTSYWYYSYSEKQSKYSLLTTIADLEDEEEYSWDNESEKLAKLIDNCARLFIKDIIGKDECKLDKSSIEHINDAHKNGRLKNTEVLDDVKKFYK